jgi:hypothetical protein
MHRKLCICIEEGRRRGRHTTVSRSDDAEHEGKGKDEWVRPSDIVNGRHAANVLQDVVSVTLYDVVCNKCEYERERMMTWT